MKEFHAAHLQIKKCINESFQTFPYEVGWAEEAIFFFTIEHITEGNPTFTAKVQLSPDGVRWADDGETPVATMSGEGVHIIKVAPNFGNFIRLDVRTEGGEAMLCVSIHCKG